MTSNETIYIFSFKIHVHQYFKWKKKKSNDKWVCVYRVFVFYQVHQIINRSIDRSIDLIVKTKKKSTKISGIYRNEYIWEKKGQENILTHSLQWFEIVEKNLEFTIEYQNHNNNKDVTFLKIIWMKNDLFEFVWIYFHIFRNLIHFFSSLVFFFLVFDQWS